jgi:YD repeat-containing protein
VYLYSYSGTLLTDNLTSVKYPDGKLRSYLYGEVAHVSATPATGVSYAHALTGIIDENGTRYASWTYDAQGRATSSEHGSFGSGIDKVRLSYGTPDANGKSTNTITDPHGNIRDYNFTTILGIVKNTGITGQPCNGCSVAIVYDVEGNIASRNDFKGNTTCYAYDLTRNLETFRLEGVAPGATCPADLAVYVPSTATGSVERKISTQWHATYRLPTDIAEPLRIISHTYDTQGNLLTRTLHATTDTTGGAGQSAIASGTPRTTTYTYNSTGQVLTADGSRTDVNDTTTYAYYPLNATCSGNSAIGCRGQLKSVTNALGHITTFGNYDANGRARNITDPNGLSTDLVYDPRGRLTSRTSGGETTGYTYDGVGQLKTVTPPGASSAAFTYTYDAAHRLTDITDGLGNTIHYTLDAMGNRTQEQTFDSAGNVIQTHSREFDALNRLWKDIGAINQTTVYEYDANGNLSKVTDPLTRTTSHTYDALNRLTTNTDAANGITRFGYDGLDQLTKVTDPKTLVTQYQKDGLGNLEQLASPDTGITVNTFDEAGNLKTRTDAKGQVTVFTYDVLNRITEIAYKPNSGANATETVAYRYDQGVNGIGHLTRITDRTGTTTYSYDQHGRLTGEVRQTQGINYNTGYGYDSQGRLKNIIYPSGRLVNYVFDTMGRINQISTSFNGISTILASNIGYEPFGSVKSFNYGDGSTAPVQSYTRSRDQDGRIASYTLIGRPMIISYDAASQISTITDPLNPLIPASYDYDALGYLTSYIQGAAAQSYYYDANGNRTSNLLSNTTYSYATGSNRLSGIQLGATAVQPVAQDANGATTSDPGRQYSYDLRGRLLKTTTAQGTINYEVNALGLRVRKQVSHTGTDTTYHYDSQSHLIGESPTGRTAFTKEYIYLGDLPVALLQ